MTKERVTYRTEGGWYGEAQADLNISQVAYFSMEFGLGEALPIYAGGLGILAGDYLKTASDLGLPVVGVGLLYQEGYFRQMIDADFSARIIPQHTEAQIPAEASLIVWQR